MPHTRQEPKLTKLEISLEPWASDILAAICLTVLMAGIYWAFIILEAVGVGA